MHIIFIGDFMNITSRRSINGFFISQGIRIVTDGLQDKDVKNRKVSKENLNLPKEINFCEIKLSTCSMYLLSKKGQEVKKIIYLLHGGSYTSGLRKMYYRVALKYLNLAENLGVVLLDYRLAPENVFPAALDDACDGWEYLTKKYDPKKIIVVGDSAGGNLSLALAMKLRDQKKPLMKAMILMSPWTDLTDSGASRVYNLYRDPMFGYSKSSKRMRLPDTSYVGKADIKNPYLSPVYGDFTDFPPMLIQVGTNEILESDSINVYKKAVLAKVNAHLSRYKGMFHVFQFVGNILIESRIAWQEIKVYINHHFK